MDTKKTENGKRGTGRGAALRTEDTHNSMKWRRVRIIARSNSSGEGSKVQSKSKTRYEKKLAGESKDSKVQVKKLHCQVNKMHLAKSTVAASNGCIVRNEKDTGSAQTIR